MKIEWATIADRAGLENGLVSLSGAGWSTYHASSFPGELRGFIAGCATYDDAELDQWSIVVASVFDDLESLKPITAGVHIKPISADGTLGPQNRAAFAIPILTEVSGETIARVHLYCRSRLVEGERIEFDRDTAGPPNYEFVFSIPEPPNAQSAEEPEYQTSSGISRPPRQLWVTRCIEKSLEEWQSGDYESAMFFATVAVDGTARRAYPHVRGSEKSFVRLIRDSALVFERFGAPRLDVSESRFEIKNASDRFGATSIINLAQILYRVHRCNYAHGDNVPEDFTLSERSGFEVRFNDPEPGISIRLPRMAIIGLLAVCVLHPANADLRVRHDGYHLTWAPPDGEEIGQLTLPLNEWFGRRDDFLAHQSQFGRSSIQIQPGRSWEVKVDNGGKGMRVTYDVPGDTTSTADEYGEPFAAGRVPPT